MSKPIIDLDVFQALITGNPRLKAMLEWRLALGVINSSDEVTQYFKEDWNKVEEFYKRVGNKLDDKEVQVHSNQCSKGKCYCHD